jgi:dUTP pyrophosphatase
MSSRIKYAITDFAKAVGCLFRAPRPGDAGYDIYAADCATLWPGGRTLVPTGLRLEVPKGYVGIIKDRSSVAMRGIAVRGGVIDAAYRGDIGVLLHNQSDAPYHIESGQRIAQLILVKIATPEAVEMSAEALSKTERGEGGWGSTGK